MKIMVLHGPNLNLQGYRENKIYGDKTLDEINNLMYTKAKQLDLDLDIYQSNYEGDLLTYIQQASSDGIGAIVLNPAALTHYSISLRDAVSACSLPVIEVHLSNIYAREHFRSNSMISPVVFAQITGCGWYGYILAIQALKEYFGE